MKLGKTHTLPIDTSHRVFEMGENENTKPSKVWFQCQGLFAPWAQSKEELKGVSLDKLTKDCEYFIALADYLLERLSCVHVAIQKRYKRTINIILNGDKLDEEKTKISSYAKSLEIIKSELEKKMKLVNILRSSDELTDAHMEDIKSTLTFSLTEREVFAWALHVVFD